MASTVVCATYAATLSTLAAAGYSLLPEPQHVTLNGAEFPIDGTWHVKLNGVASGDVAIESLAEDMATRHGLRLAPGKDGPAIELTITGGSVSIGPAQDKDKGILAAQAYRIELSEHGIVIAANAPAGLFYGVETLVQLVKHRDGGLWLPAGQIIDWPDLQLRQIYWDNAHHLERLDAFKQAIRQAAFFKINGFVLKLEGHFQYRSAPALVEPYALSPAEYQQLTDYALRYYVQLIPYLDAPGHIAFILKHPQYAPLRAFPDNNYELCVANPQSLKLLHGMYQDLLDANQGGKYFYLSTDEAYYVGMADDARFSEAMRQRELGSQGKLLAEFVTKAAGYLHERGRTVVIWVEWPMLPGDVAALPDYVVDGVPGTREMNAAVAARRLRMMIYTPTQGEEAFFPDYFLQPASRCLHKAQTGHGRLSAGIEAITANPARNGNDLMGLFIAGWGDSGLHPETFWLGFATLAAAGWNPRVTDTAAAGQSFYRQFYGPSAVNMQRVYQLMSLQGQFWKDSWETCPSTARTPIWGNSSTIHHPRRPANDQTLPLPCVPAGDNLTVDSSWTTTNARRLELVDQHLLESDELLGLLHQNIRQIEYHSYNIEVFISIAQLCRHNLLLLKDLARADSLIAAAHISAVDNQPSNAVASLDQALDLVSSLRQRRNELLQTTTDTWYKTWCPRVAEANGRQFVHELDDVKDHLPDRTVGMEFLVYRELLLPLGDWVGKVQEARNTYAREHGMAQRADGGLSGSWNPCSPTQPKP